jgi:2-amino-4-hydroxy-6-hydroxymethyldihydropteridine diphosphokinase
MTDLSLKNGQCAIGLGSNLGDSRATLNGAIANTSSDRANRRF